MKIDFLTIFQFIEFVKTNSWFLSIVAIFISFISVTFVIVDKVKVWNELSRNKRLKTDKAILQTIIELKIEDFSDVRLVQRASVKSTIHEAHYSKLYNLFQNIDTNKLTERKIAGKIEEIKKMSDKDLFALKSNPNKTDFSYQFSQVVSEVIKDSKIYLANVT